jgi:hypothetical protein
MFGIGGWRQQLTARIEVSREPFNMKVQLGDQRPPTTTAWRVNSRRLTPSSWRRSADRIRPSRRRMNSAPRRMTR